MADAASGPMQGYLTKRGHLVKNWLRRWFVLEGSNLIYFADKASKTEKGRLNLQAAVVTAVDEDVHKRANVLCIRCLDGEKLYFQTDGAADTTAWLEALKAAAASAVSLAGVLQQQGGFRKKWRDRYFVLSGPQLAWFDSEASVKAPGGGKSIGCVSLYDGEGKGRGGSVLLAPDGASVPGVEEDALPRLLVVTAVGAKGAEGERLLLLAATTVEAATWLQNLRSACTGAAAPTGSSSLVEEEAEPEGAGGEGEGGPPPQQTTEALVPPTVPAGPPSPASSKPELTVPAGPPSPASSKLTAADVEAMRERIRAEERECILEVLQAERALEQSRLQGELAAARETAAAVEAGAQAQAARLEKEAQVTALAAEQLQLAAATAAAERLHQEREEAAALAEVVRLRQEREAAAAQAEAARLRQEREAAAAQADAARIRQEREEAAALAEVARLRQMREAAAAQAEAVRLRQEREEAAALAEVARLRQEREAAAAQAEAARLRQEREAAAAQAEAARLRQEREEAAALVVSARLLQEREAAAAQAEAAPDASQSLGSGGKPPRAASRPTASLSRQGSAVGEVVSEATVSVATARALFNPAESRRPSRDHGALDVRAEIEAQRVSQGQTEYEGWGLTGGRGERRAGDEEDDMSALEAGRVRGVAGSILGPKGGVTPLSPGRAKGQRSSGDAVPPLSASSVTAAASASALPLPAPPALRRWSVQPDDEERASMRSRVGEYLLKRTPAAANDPTSPTATYILTTLAGEVEDALYGGAGGHQGTYGDTTTLKARLKQAMATRTAGREAMAQAVWEVAPPPAAPLPLSTAFTAPVRSEEVVEMEKESGEGAGAGAGAGEVSTSPTLGHAAPASPRPPVKEREEGAAHAPDTAHGSGAQAVQEAESRDESAPPDTSPASTAFEEVGLDSPSSSSPSPRLKSKRPWDTDGSVGRSASVQRSRPAQAVSPPGTPSQPRQEPREAPIPPSPASSVQPPPAAEPGQARWGNAPHPGGAPPRHYPAQVDGGGLHLKLVLEKRPEGPPDLPALNKWQHRQCAECGMTQSTGMFGVKARFCWYTELLYCPACMAGGEPDGEGPGRGSMRPLPWRVVQSLDDTPFPVCRAAVGYIDSVWEAPLVPLTAVAPATLMAHSSLQRISALRGRLADLKEEIAKAAARIPRGGKAVAPTAQGEPYARSYLLPSTAAQAADVLASTSPTAAIAMALVGKLLAAALGRSLTFLGEALELLPLSLVIPAASSQGSGRILARLTDACRRLETVSVSLQDGSMGAADLIHSAEEAGVDVDKVLGALDAAKRGGGRSGLRAGK